MKPATSLWRRGERGRRRGAAAVEFALTLPIMMSVLIFGIEFGWYFTRLAMVNSATQDAVRYAARGDNGLDAAVLAQNTARILLQDMGFECPCGQRGRSMIVGGVPMVDLEVAVPYEQLTGALPSGTSMIAFVSPTTLRAHAAFPFLGN